MWRRWAGGGGSDGGEAGGGRGGEKKGGWKKTRRGQHNDEKGILAGFCISRLYFGSQYILIQQQQPFDLSLTSLAIFLSGCPPPGLFPCV